MKKKQLSTNTLVLAMLLKCEFFSSKVSNSTEDKKRRKEIFDGIDVSGNGHLSLVIHIIYLLDIEGTYKFGGTSSGFWYPKARKFDGKNLIH